VWTKCHNLIQKTESWRYLMFRKWYFLIPEVIIMAVKPLFVLETMPLIHVSSNISVRIFQISNYSHSLNRNVTLHHFYIVVKLLGLPWGKGTFWRNSSWLSSSIFCCTALFQVVLGKRTSRAWNRCFVGKIQRPCFSPMSLLLRY
jgi:hypothetical protein